MPPHLLRHLTTASGLRLGYIEQGLSDAAPVLLVHGFTRSTASQFIEPGVVAGLSHAHRVIGLDLRGHGHSDKPHQPEAYGAQMGLDLLRLLDHLGIERAHILGYSMGAHCVAQLLTTHPERFVSAVLGGSCGRRSWSAEDQQRVDIEAAELDQQRMDSQIRRLWPTLMPPPSVQQLQEISQQLLAGQDPQALAAVRRSNPAQVVSDAQMADVQVPTLGLVGSADPYLEAFRALAGLMPAMRLVEVAGASHGELPGHPAFVTALQGFFAQHG